MYDQYYASLAASRVASASNTPSGLSVPEGDDFGDDEEDRKPSLQLLNSLNDYRKRSRSNEDVGTAKKKAAKIEETGDAIMASLNILAQHESVHEPQQDLPLDDPIVMGLFDFLHIPVVH